MNPEAVNKGGYPEMFLFVKFAFDPKQTSSVKHGLIGSDDGEDTLFHDVAPKV